MSSSSSSRQNDYKPVSKEDPDVVEIKKALATGSGSPDKSAVSGGKHFHFIFLFGMLGAEGYLSFTYRMLLLCLYFDDRYE